MGRTLLTGLDAVAHYARISPDVPALIASTGSVSSYAELWADLASVCQRIERVGIGPGASVAVLTQQGPLQLISVFGALTAGICAPLQPRTTLDEVEAALDRLHAEALIVSPEFPDEAAAALARGVVVIRASESMSPNQWPIDFPAVRRRVSPIAANATLLLMTSATTGHSKIVPLSTANLDASVAARHKTLGLTDRDRLLMMTSLCHIIGIVNPLAQWLAGGTVIITGGFDPSAYVRWLLEYKPTWYTGSPTVHQAALAQLESAVLRQPLTLRFLQSAGAPLPAITREKLESLLDVPVWNDYGMTEANPIAVDVNLASGRIAGSAGRSCGSVEIGILNDSGLPLTPRETGEIAVRGPAVFSCYLDDPEATRNAFSEDWLKTGDLGRLDVAGNLYILGRLKEMINRGGEKIVPAEVDAVITAHPAVLEAASFPVPHPTLGEDVACAVVLRPNTPHVVSVPELRRFASERLPTFKVPRHIRFVDRIPRGELGKPQRWMLKGQFAKRHVVPAAETVLAELKIPPQTVDIYFKIREIWCRILDREEIAFDEDFFEAGGDSLSAMNMLAEVDEYFGSATAASAADFLDQPMLLNLANMIDKPLMRPALLEIANEMLVYPVRSHGLSRRLYCIPAEQQEGLYFRGLARHLEGRMDLAIIRRPRAYDSQALRTFERDGADIATAIRTEQSEGPYFIAGYCYGGVIAFETARQLVTQGQQVRLILFDVPIPGWPGALGYIPVWLDRARRDWVRVQTQATAGLGAPVRRLRWLKRILGVLARRTAWSALTSIRAWLAPLDKLPPVHKFIRWAQSGYFPLYRAREVNVAVLQFLCVEERGREADARFEWRKLALKGVTEKQIAFDHANVFHESNLPAISSTILQWTDSESGANSEEIG